MNNLLGRSSIFSSTPFCPRTLLWLALSVVRYPQFVYARPTSEVLRRASDNNGVGSNGNGVSANVWIPVLIVAVVVAVLTLIACVRRATHVEVSAGATTRTSNTPAGQAASARPGRRRRPARTPSQISTKSLPPYMLEPGDQELVIYRGPLKMEDDHDPMSIMEEDDEHPETRGTHHGLDLESHGTAQADDSATNLIYNVSGDMPMRRSVDVVSVGTSHHSQESHSELLPLHTTQTSEDPRGEAPPYFEVVGQDTTRYEPPASETSINDAAPDRRSRFSFLFNPFGGSSRHPPISIYNRASTPDHTRNVSSLSVASTNSGHGRNHSGSHSTLLKTLRSHDHSTHMTSPSTISLNSISAPLTHTVIRSEFRAPKGGITPEQIKLITSRNALERFGVPYGPDAVAFSASRSNMAPPPDFDATVSSSPVQLEASGSSSAGLRNASSPTLERETTGSPSHNSATADEAGHTTSSSIISGSPSSSPSGAEKKSQLSSPPRSPLSSSYQRHRDDSRSSSVTSFETAASELEHPTTPLTARPVTPVTARPIDV